MHAGDRQSKFMSPYYGLLHSLDFLGVTSRLRLGSLPCIVCCMLRFAYAHGVVLPPHQRAFYGIRQPHMLAGQILPAEESARRWSLWRDVPVWGSRGVGISRPRDKWRPSWSI